MSSPFNIKAIGLELSIQDGLIDFESVWRYYSFQKR